MRLLVTVGAGYAGSVVASQLVEEGHQVMVLDNLSKVYGEPTEAIVRWEKEPDVLGFLRSFLSLREWIYLLSLLIPFIVYDLTLKDAVLRSIPGVVPSFYLMRSNVFFDLGYALLWFGLFAAAPRKGAVRRSVVVLFHATTVLVIIVFTSSYQYFKMTGTTLNYSVIALWLPDPGEVTPVLAGSVPLSAWALLLVALFYATLGPWLLIRIIGKWRRWTSGAWSGVSRVSLSISLGLWVLAFGLGLFSLLLGANWSDYPSGTSVALVRQPFVNVLLTGFEEAATPEVDDQGANVSVKHPAAHATLAPTSQARERNVVLVSLESTRAEATTPTIAVVRLLLSSMSWPRAASWASGTTLPSSTPPRPASPSTAGWIHTSYSRSRKRSQEVSLLLAWPVS